MIPLKRNLAVLIAILATVGCSPASEDSPRDDPSPSVTPQEESDGAAQVEPRLLLEADLRNYSRAVEEAKDAETGEYPASVADLPTFEFTPGTEVSPKGYAPARGGFMLSLTNAEGDSMWYDSTTGELVRSWESIVATEDDDEPSPSSKSSLEGDER